MFELIGIFFSTWFVYRYLLFKPDRCVARRAPRGAARRANPPQGLPPLPLARRRAAC